MENLKEINQNLPWAWGSVPIGQCETQNYPIVNNTDHTIELKGIVIENNNSFKFLNDSNLTTHITIKLQPMEHYTLAVIFSPYVIGAAIGKVIFTKYEYEEDDKVIKTSLTTTLHGYGGNGKLLISNDQIIFSLCDIHPDGILNARIKIENTGDLSAYAKLKLTPTMIYFSLQNHWNIQPTEFILKPQEIKYATIQFRPRKQDLASINDMGEIGRITIVHGDEPTRWRVRKLYEKMCETKQINIEDKEDIFNTFIQPICRKFPGEQQLISDYLNEINDSPDVLEILSRQIHQSVVILKIKINNNDTILNNVYAKSYKSLVIENLKTDCKTEGDFDVCWKFNS